MVAGAAIRPAQPGIGGGGSSGVTTGSVTVLAPLVLSGTEIQLPVKIATLNTNMAFTNYVDSSDNITTVLSNAANGTRIEMEAGTYTVTPSILNSNLITSTVFQGVKLINKTNVTIKGVKGLTVWDGSGGLGEVFVITNCDNVTIEGVTFRGYTNHNFMALPVYNGMTNQNSYLWALVNYYACSRLTFKDCTFERSADHGLQDKGAENSSFLASSILSTNQIRIINNTFSDIGGMRTNQAGGFQTDGTAIICTDALVDGNYFVNCFRGFEPYNEGESSGNVTFNNTQFRNNTMINIAEHFITLAGSTNGNGIVIDGNYLYREPGFLYHGTNTDNGFGGAYGIGINMNGGNRHVIRGNVIRNMASSGISIQSSQDNPVTGVSVVGNFIDGATNAADTAYGMFIGDPVYSKIFPVRNLYLANNTIRNAKTYAIYALGLSDSTIENNELINPVFPGAGAAIVLQTATNGANYSMISNVVVRQNQIKDTGTAEMTYGINLVGAGLAIQTFDNRIENGTTGTILNGAGDGLTQYDTTAGSTSRLLRAFDSGSVQFGSITSTNVAFYGTISNIQASAFYRASGSSFAGFDAQVPDSQIGLSTVNGLVVTNASGSKLNIRDAVGIHASFASTGAVVVGHLTVGTNITAQSFIGSGTGSPVLQLFATNNNAVVMGIAISNSVMITNLVGQLHKANAVYIELDCNHGNDFHITNRIAQNTIVNWLNPAQGQTLSLRLHGAVATGSDWFVTNTFPTGWLVANQSSNSAPMAVQLPVSVLDGTGAELNIRPYRLFTGSTNIAGAIINTYTE